MIDSLSWIFVEYQTTQPNAAVNVNICNRENHNLNALALKEQVSRGTNVKAHVKFWEVIEV